MNVLFVTTWVLGDSGANAADIFPRLAVQNEKIGTVIVADFPRNKHHIVAHQKAEYLRLERGQPWVRYAVRIARKCRQNKIDVVHVFYRQKNALLLILLRLCLCIFSPQTQVVMDHRSVNLAKGPRKLRKMIVNQLMQFFTHHLAGNPWAVETNHWAVFRPKHVIDLGYDKLPPAGVLSPTSRVKTVDVWFIGSLKPKNRKSEFLLDIFDEISEQQSKCSDPTLPKIRFRVAGPASNAQRTRMKKNPAIVYYGKLPRERLYQTMQSNRGIGLAFMNEEFHGYAPSLKFAEYAALRFQILASDTIGLRTQCGRMQLDGLKFLPETVEDWVAAIRQATMTFNKPVPVWKNAPKWSYRHIFQTQVVGLYESITSNNFPSSKLKSAR